MVGQSLSVRKAGVIRMLQRSTTTPSPQPSLPRTGHLGVSPLPLAGEGWGEGGTGATARPTRTIQLLNFAVFQSAWFAAVLGAAHQRPLWGTAAVLAAFAWHLSVSARPAEEAKLFGLICLIGFVVETANVLLGHVAYPSGQPVPQLPPYWMVALWGLLATALNVTMRWLKRRYWLAAVLGAIAGPMSFIGGVKLGGAQFIDATPALVIMAGSWAVLMPALMWLSMRFDGVAVPQAQVQLQVDRA
jgi:hypothetical protein